MASLAEVVRALAARPGVAGVLLCSADGLPVDRAGDVGDADAVAALAAAAVKHARELADAGAQGPLRTLVVEGDQALLLLAPVTDGAWLAVRAGLDADAAELLFALRQHAPALAPLL